MYRIVFGLCLFIYFATQLLERQFTGPFVIGGAVASLFFLIGWYDRLAAVVMLCVLVLLGDPSTILAGWLLVAHLLLPPAPFWSWAARGRVDPRGNWSMPPWLFAVSWIVMIGAYVYGFRYGFGELGFGMVLLHLLNFNPAWIPRHTPAATDRVLYDGSCGLCHRSVRLLIAEDVSGTSFVYVPQEGGGSTVIVETADGRTLTHTAAVIHLLHRLGGFWRLTALVFTLVPRVLRDAAYDLVARVRYRIFGKTKDACPLMPPDLRSRFR
jgi:predicted DCC family thiol-disulfide oxidoreductase YuxK